MTHRAKVTVEFPCPRHELFEALLDLDRYPLWNSGMVKISHDGPMTPGLIYSTVTHTMGRSNEATVHVIEIVPDEAIVLESRAGIVTFHATFQLKTLSARRSAVSVHLRFSFSRALFNLAQPVAEAIAESRIRADLETLRALMGSSHP
jgi:hypothetical protein